MPHETSTDSPKPIPSGATTSAAANGGVAASPATHEALIRRAKDIIGGRRPPEPLVLSPRVTAFLDYERTHGQLKEVEPTEEALWDLTNWLNLQVHYGGRMIATYTTKRGLLTVLAVGGEEIGALLRGLSGDETLAILIQWPDPPLTPDGGPDVDSTSHS